MADLSCAHCYARFERPAHGGTGRHPPRFCSGPCRQAAYRRRTRNLPEDLSPAEYVAALADAAATRMRRARIEEARTARGRPTQPGEASS